MMKKLYSALLVLALCLSLGACSVPGGVSLPPVPTAEQTSEPAASPEPTPEPTPAPATPAPAGEGEVLVSIRRTVREAFDPQSGETRILRFAYDTPSVVEERSSEAADRINETLATLDEAYYTGEDYGDGPGTGYNNMLTLAEDNYLLVTEGGVGGSVELSADRSVTVERNDGRVLVFRYADHSYTGGAHGSYSYRCYCFDPATGELLTLAGLSDDEQALRGFLLEQMLALAESDQEIREKTEGYMSELPREQSLGALLREGSWYFDYDGLVIFSDLYEISSYAAGPVSFRIPWERLRDRVDARFFPEEPSGSGSLRVVAGEDMADGSTEIVDMLRVHEDGETVYLVADGRVRDIRISSVEYSTYFYETAQLWCSSGMTDAALQIVTVIPEGMPNLMIRCRGAEGEQRFYLSQSGEDGSLILVDDSIEAVG